jgi:hypothetical protein
MPVLTVDQMAKTKTVKASALLMEQPESNYFGDLLGVLNEEELIRLRRRLEKTGKLRTAEVLADEIRKSRIVDCIQLRAIAVKAGDRQLLEHVCIN